MKTVTICGSMRFEKEMQEIAFDLETRHEMNVLQCVYNAANREISEAERNALAKAHFQKIALCDAIYVVDIEGYIGASVMEEIHFAQANGKEVIFHSKHATTCS